MATFLHTAPKGTFAKGAGHKEKRIIARERYANLKAEEREALVVAEAGVVVTKPVPQVST